MENKTREQLEELIKVYGADMVLQCAQGLLMGKPPTVTHDVSERSFLGAAKVLDFVAGLIAKAEKAALNVVDHSKAARSIPAEHFRIIAPQFIEATLEQLDSTVNEILRAGERREAAHKERGPLLQRKEQLLTDIKLTESDALCSVQGTGKDAYVMVGGQKLFLPNEDARNAYRRTLTQAQRTELASIEGQLAAAEAEAARYKMPFDTAVEAAASIRAKAAIQAALLNYLAGGR